MNPGAVAASTAKIEANWHSFFFRFNINLRMPSSVIQAYEYDTSQHTLRITFVSGKIYVYKAVPKQVYVGMRGAVSKGKYFNSYIKDLYDFEEVE